MKTRSPRILGLAPLSLLGLTVATATSGCLTRPVDALDTRTTWTANFRQIRSGVDKIDLVLMIDNSGSMADKQAILSDAVPNLVKGLLNPPCIGDDDQPVSAQPASPADACPAGSARAFQPVYDVHIGIVSSSLGGHGSNSCGVQTAPPANHPDDTTYKASWSNDDQGHLLSRKDATKPDGDKVETYQGQGFLAWDPNQKLTPPGEQTLDGTVAKLRDMVQGVGQIGCGYESQLESWYRFLVDPEPYQTIAMNEKGNVEVSGVDQQLLDERAAFLRPDSMVAVLMLTDENDCSTREEKFFPVINNLGNVMPSARAVCQTDPEDRCCAPCGFAPVDCPADDGCAAKPTLTAEEDPINLRCWDQKRRYGWNFLYPTERYVTALSSPQIAKRNGELVENPLFPADPDGHLNARRPETGLVFLAGIVGVPWQDIARQRQDGTPDLVGGLDAHGNAVGGFMGADELTKRDPATMTSRWDVILGNPAKHQPPLDPLMRESRLARSGQNPVTGDALAPPDSKSATANPINGHEWNTDTEKDQAGNSVGDLQYACVFDLVGEATNTSDCADADTSGSQNPLCQSKSDGSYGKAQRRAKAYPGTRHLEVLKGMADQGIVASVCPVQVTDASKQDYGYQPAIGAIIDRLRYKLKGPCLTRPLTPSKDGQVSCVVIEAQKSQGEACCSGQARRAVSADHEAMLKEAQADFSAAGADCFCEIDQLHGDGLSVCQNDVSVVPVGADSTPVNGWCYVDDQTGAAALLDGCSAGQRYKVRYVGAGQPAADAVTFITCAGGGS
jgi:hypothetical protein